MDAEDLRGAGCGVSPPRWYDLLVPAVPIYDGTPVRVEDGQRLAMGHPVVCSLSMVFDVVRASSWVKTSRSSQEWADRGGELPRA